MSLENVIVNDCEIEVTTQTTWMWPKLGNISAGDLLVTATLKLTNLAELGHMKQIK